MSIGMACVFIPTSSTALVGVSEHDAGVASALLNTSQQVGGSLGTALLNTLYAGAVTGFLADNLSPSADKAQIGQATSDAFIHGYHVAFFWGAMMLLVALFFAVLLINAKKDDIPQEPGVPAAA